MTNEYPDRNLQTASLQGKDWIDRIFLEHPRSAGETYTQHMWAALAYGVRLAGLACCAIIHGLVPHFHKTTTSEGIFKLSDHLRRRCGPKDNS